MITWHFKISTYLAVKGTMKNKDHQPLKRIEDGEYVLERDGIRTKAKNSKHPGNSDQRKNGHGDSYSSP